MNWNDFAASMERAARSNYEQGVSSKELFKQAEDQERTGFSVSAPYTRLLATLVEAIERKEVA